MANYAVLKDNVVVNIIVWDGDKKSWKPESEFTTAEIKESDFADLEYIYDATSDSFISPKITDE